MQYTLVRNEEGESNITVFVPGAKPLSAHSTHPQFEEIVKKVLAEDSSALELFDIAKTASGRFKTLTKRIKVKNGEMYLDGVAVHDSLSEQVVRFLEEGVTDWKPLVRFYENLQENPNEHSRQQLYTWLDKKKFTITKDGMIVGYKGVNSKKASKGSPFVYQSSTAGTATVNGRKKVGNIPQGIGSVVTMPRDQVAHNPSQDCSTGLHVGNYRYASGFATLTLEVHVHPRDVVSVPSDSSCEKMRVCKYLVVKEVKKEHTAPVVADFKPNKSKTSILTPAAFEVKVGDVFEDADARRAGRLFQVKEIEGDSATGLSLPTRLTRTVKLDRLVSRKYRKVAKKRAKEALSATKS